MDGNFLDLDAEAIEAEVDEYWRELYKIQKVFNKKLKILIGEREERERERKKRRRHMEESEEQEAEEEEPEVTPPASLDICNSVQESMKDFKVSAKNRGHIWGQCDGKVMSLHWQCLGSRLQVFTANRSIARIEGTQRLKQSWDLEHIGCVIGGADLHVAISVFLEHGRVY